ncbi:MAG: NAD(P)-dependent oxidoreductase [Gammaproteobacteria bacterium]|nr:NAD(P)-dependent oxidoreductase [Gammaproteobacteria bacterium]
MEVKTIGFVGLGLMGTAMATNLAKAGFSLRGFDPNPAAVEALSAHGMVGAASPSEVANAVELVIVMVPDVPELEATFSGANGLLSTPGNGRIVMVMCTVDPSAVVRLAGDAQAAGWAYVDCPVGRTADDAKTANSMFMLGGDADAKAAVRPALDAMGTTVIDCGEVGHAMTIKIVNNFMSTVGAVVVAEALRFAEAGGLSAEKVLEVVNGTVAGNGHSKMHFPNKVLAGDSSPGFAMKHARKDVNIARMAMERAGFPCYLAPGAIEAFDKGLELGHGDNDWSDLYHVIEKARKKDDS